ncbi:MAG: A24 family peptidase [Planctomycetota bacterium]
MDWNNLIATQGHVLVVSAILIWAAWIDGRELRVPNWQTLPMILAGLIFNTYTDGWAGLQFALYGTVVGLACLMPLYLVGGMGAGDVKLMGGIGAWLGASVTWNAFLVCTIVGAVMAVCMVAYRGTWRKHYANCMMILHEFRTIQNPNELSRIAAERKPTMFLLPYGIPICVGSLAYFAYEIAMHG